MRLLKGSALVGTRYEPLFNPHKFGVERRRAEVFKGPDGVERKEFRVQNADPNLTYRVIATDFVTMDDGTGIVHVAPAFGEVDFDAGLEKDLDFVQQVDLPGKITGTYSFAGKFVKTADKEIWLIWPLADFCLRAAQSNIPIHSAGAAIRLCCTMPSRPGISAPPQSKND